MIFDDAPFDGGQVNHRQPPPAQVLLVTESLISGQEKIKAVIFGCPDEFAVLESIPTHVTGGKNLMIAELIAQAVIQIFIEQYLHAQRCRCWP
jgi:hypothetical protein